MNKNNFIFVVCGAKEHIDTLHFSLRYLKKHSKNEIWVLTDSSRNEIPIAHDKIIDIQTPPEFSHHQASIYLKTGIHKFIPAGKNYCYLDTDVVAITENADDIFKQFIAPITFAGDSISIDYFSPYALNCGCLDQYLKNVSLLKSILDDIESKIQQSKEKSSYRIRKWLYKLPFRFYHLNSEYKLEKKTGVWYKKDGTPLTINHFHQINNGENKCSHLRLLINEEYDPVQINDNWQHWNGGVFLFNDLSHDFLETWHQFTLQAFKDPFWKTRDQGTLIKTICSYGLQNHPMLDKKWNFIADSDHCMIACNQDGYFTDDGWKTKQKVNFVHIIHRFGDSNWNLWNYIVKKG